LRGDKNAPAEVIVKWILLRLWEDVPFRFAAFRPGVYTSFDAAYDIHVDGPA
jgi:hypothetical protein